MFSTDPSTIAALWSRARAMFARASVIIGSAQTLAAIATLTRVRRREIADWLALAESIVRKLLFAEAGLLAQSPHERHQVGPRTSSSALLATPHHGASKAAPPARPEAARSTLDRLAPPETWRVRFALAPPRDPRAVPESRAPRIRALWGPSPPPAPPPITQSVSREHSTPLPLARRLEALRRVFNDPAPYARRLAHIFRRLSRRDPQAAPRYAIAATRSHAVDPGDPRLIVEIIAAAMTAAQIFANST